MAETGVADNIASPLPRELVAWDPTGLTGQRTVREPILDVVVWRETLLRRGSEGDKAIDWL